MQIAQQVGRVGYTLMMAPMVRIEQCCSRQCTDCYICQRSRYIDQMVKLVVSGVLRENTSMIICYDPDEHDLSSDCDVCGDGQYRIQTYDSSGCVNCGQVNTCLVTLPVIMRASLIVKYADEADIAMTDMDLAPGVIAGKYITDHEVTVGKHNHINDCAVCARGQYRTVL